MKDDIEIVWSNRKTKWILISIFGTSLFVGTIIFYMISPKGEGDIVRAVIGVSVFFTIAYLGIDFSIKFARWRHPDIFDNRPPEYSTSSD